MPIEYWEGWDLPDHWTLDRETDDVLEVTRTATGHRLRVERVRVAADDAPELDRVGWQLSLGADGDDEPALFVASLGCRAGAVRALHRAIEAVDEPPVEATAPRALANFADDLAVRPSPE